MGVDASSKFEISAGNASFNLHRTPTEKIMEWHYRKNKKVCHFFNCTFFFTYMIRLTQMVSVTIKVYEGL